MLIGAYPGSLNDKRRVAIPKKFLAELGEKPVLAKWYEDCLILVSNNFWETLLERLVGPNKLAGLGVRNIERFILGSAFELEPDDQGRVVIPEILSSYAGLDKDLVFVGLTNRVEIWSRQAWDKLSSELSKITKEYIESISKLTP
jgi:MraZ protein